MTRLTSKKLLSFIAASFLTLVATPALAGEPSVKAEEKARGLVERNQRIIACFAHPTSKFRDLQHVSTEALPSGGFKVIYAMNYTAFRGCGCRFYSNLAFTFDDDGSYRNVETAGRNCSVGPFTASDAAIGVIQAVVRNEPELRDNFELLKMFEKSDARDILKFVLALSR